MKWIYANPNSYACVDDADYNKVKNFTWAVYKDGYFKVKIEGKSPVHLHQKIIGKVSKPWGIDHVNRDKKDHRRVNLRIVDYVVSNKNRGTPKIEMNPTKKEMVYAKKQWEHVKSNRHLYSELYRKRLRPVVNKTRKKVFPGAYYAAMKYNLNQTLITACCAGRRKTHGGFKWEYFDPEKHTYLLLM